MHISMAFLNPGDGVLIPDPGYPTYTSVTKLVGAVPITYTLSEDGGWLPDLEVLSKMDLGNVRLLWISYPNMPTGARISLEKMRALVAFAKAHDILIVNDNPYSFVLNDAPTSILQVAGARAWPWNSTALVRPSTWPAGGWAWWRGVGSTSMPY